MASPLKTIKVVAALITDGKRVFATARGYGNYKGWWEFPGGKVEQGETPEDALVREIREELDSEIRVDEYIDTIEYDYPEFHLSMRCYWCSLISGDLVLKEAEDAKWLDVETLDSVKWLPADITLIDKIREKLNSDAVDTVITRVSEMETIMDKALSIMDNAKENPEQLLSYQPEIKKLEDYYEGPDWKHDFALDEEGKLPSDLKRGVLSEDGIYDLLERNKELLEGI